LELKQTEQINRKESFASDCEQEIRDLMDTEIKKKFSMIYSVQFHNVVAADSMNKVLCFKFDQKYLEQARQPAGVSVGELRSRLKDCKPGDSENLWGLNMTVKEKISQFHCLLDIEYFDAQGALSTYPNVLLSYLDHNERAYVTMFPLGAGEEKLVSSDEFVIVSQALR